MFNFKKHGMKKNYVTTAVALLLLAGCSNAESYKCMENTVFCTIFHAVGAFFD